MAEEGVSLGPLSYDVGALARNKLSVIPASEPGSNSAGLVYARTAQSSGGWIPAFAGMTTEGVESAVSTLPPR